MNIVRNTITEGTETYRERSRIGSINHRIWSVIAPMLFIAFGLFGVNVNAWGQLYGKAVGIVSPSNAGQVRVSYDNSTYTGWSTTTATNEGSKGNFLNSSKDFTMAFQANESNEAYDFYGWYDNENGTGTAISTEFNITQNITSSTRNGNNKKNNPATIKRYAVFKAKPVFYFKATATTNNSTYGNAYVTFTESSKTTATTPEATTNCYGTQYNTTSMTKTAYFRAVPETGYVFKGWSTTSSEDDIFNTDKSITYDLTSSSKKSAEPASIRYYAIFGEKFAPQITGTASENKEVGDSYTADFSFVNTSSTTPSSSNTADFHYTINQKLSTSVNNGTDVISFDPSTKLITALNAGTATIIFTNKSTTTHQFAEESFTIAVTKKTPTFSCGTSMKVDENLSCTYTNTSANTPTANSSDNFYYEFTNNTPAGNTNGSDTPGAILTFSGNKIYGKNAGIATITFYQKETYKYTGAEKSFNVSVTKHDNTIKVKGSANYSSSIYVDSYDNGLTLTADNTDYTNCPITNKQTAGTDIATFYQNDKVVYSSYKLGTATWTLSQAENYKYVAAVDTLTVNVVKGSTTCSFYTHSAQQELGDDWIVCEWSDYYATELSFQAAKNMGTAIGDLNVYIKLNTGGWQKYKTIKVGDLSGSWGSYDFGSSYFTYSLASNVRGIKFENAGDYKRAIKNLSIKRNSFMTLSTDEITMPTNTMGGNQTTAKFTVNYSTCADMIKVVCNHPHITVSPASFDSNGEGAKEITVTYACDEPESIDGVITVYTPYENKTISVHATTEKKSQEIEWSQLFNGESVSLPQTFTSNDAASATSNLPVTYVSGNPSIIEVAEDGLSFTIVGVGTTTLTASQDGNELWKSVSETKTIVATNKKIQRIIWNQQFTRSLSVGNEIPLTATVSVLNVATGIETESDERSAEIVYTCPADNGVIEIYDGTNIRVLDYGNTTITAYVSGNEEYEAASSVTLPVRVREAQTGDCDMPLVMEQNEEIEFFQSNTNEIVGSALAIDRTKGIPDKLSFDVRGAAWKLVIEYYKGSIQVQQSTDNQLHWSGALTTVSPAKGETRSSGEIQLDPNATHIRFVRPDGGQGYHYVGNVQISRLPYIRTENATINLGNISMGEKRQFAIPVSYCNVKGNMTISKLYSDNGLTMDEVIEAECGDRDTYEVHAYIQPTAVGPWSNVVTIRDQLSNMYLNVTINATIQKGDQVITWNPTLDILATEVPELNAVASSGLAVSYEVTSGNNIVARIDNGQLIILQPGQFTITASQSGNSNYNQAPTVEKTFNISAETLTIFEAPVAGDITYGQTLSASTLTGGSVQDSKGNTVAGSFSWQTATTVPNAGDNQNFTVVFTPKENAAWYNTLTTSVAVNVDAATPEATPSAANIVYGQKVNESELSNEGTAGTWSWTDAKAEDVLAAGTYNGLAVHFKPTSGNYTELDATVSLTVEKATPEVTAQASAITYGQAISASELSTATGNISGTWDWAVDKTQVLSVGDHVLKANFTSTNANYSDLSNVDVTLTVNKIEKLEVPVALSFCAGGSVNFHGNTYSEAGEYQVEAEGTTRDTVYNVTVTKLQPTTGTDSKTITVGANESWNGINLSGYAVGSHEVVFHTENVAGCDSTVTLTLTVVPATNIFTNAAGNGDWEDPANWQSGSVPSSDPDIIVTGALEVNEDITVGNLTIESTGSVAVISGGTLTVNGTSEDRTEYGDVHVMSDGALALGISANLQVRDFTLDAALGNSSNAATSGQVSGDVNLHINRDAYFQMSFDPRGEIDYGWYDFTVPFEVEVLNGVYDEHMNKLTNGIDYIAMNFNEARRASSGKGWSTFSGTMQPGRIYSIGFDETKTWNTFIFKKKSGSYLLSNGSFTTECSNVGAADDRGWNGLGNGTLQHRELTSLNGEKVQVYNHSEDCYEAYDADEKAYAVGTAFFVQADANMGTIDLTTTDGTKALRAPQYASRALDEFRLTLTAEGEDRYTDRMWVSASDEATGEYVIGHDLLKMGTPKDAKVAQMWTVNNDLRLCDIEMPLINDMSQCPLMFFAPNALTYEIAVDQAPEDATLYLTYNDRIIWSLSASPYTIDLEKGMTEGYGLRIVARHNAPSVATGMDELNVDEDGNRKVLIDNMLYIITPEGAMYSVTGEKVK